MPYAPLWLFSTKPLSLFSRSADTGCGGSCEAAGTCALRFASASSSILRKVSRVTQVWFVFRRGRRVAPLEALPRRGGSLFAEYALAPRALLKTAVVSDYRGRGI